VENIDQILTTLTYDDKVEVTVQLITADQQVKLYRVTNQFISTTGMVYTPCGVCPVSLNAHNVLIDLNCGSTIFPISAYRSFAGGYQY